MKQKTKNSKMPDIFDVTKYTLLSDNILVEAVENTSMTSGIIRPNQYEDKPEFGKVLTVGIGVDKVIKVGYHVLFNKYVSTKFRIDGKDVYVVRLEDLVGYYK